MAFKQFTKCEQPENFIDLSGTAIGWRNIFILIASGLFVGWFLIVIVNVAATVAAVVFFTLAVAYLYWWLNGRLICLANNEQCLIGVITTLGPADPIQKAGDNDFSMYLLLPPGPTKLTEPKTVYWNTQPQGQLVAENAKVLAIGRGYVQGGDDHQAYVTSLHCEFEGDGIDTLYTWAKVILALLIAILFVPPVIKAILALLALFLTLMNVLDVLTSPPGLSGSGDPRDIDPLLGLASGDIVIIKGEWIYDSLHHGWNEIHPVRDCQVIGRMDLGAYKDPATPAAPWPSDLGGIGIDTTPKVEMALARWCGKLDEARVTEDGGSRTDPQNDWVIHPLIDGCKPPPVIL